MTRQTTHDKKVDSIAAKIEKISKQINVLETARNQLFAKLEKLDPDAYEQLSEDVHNNY